MPLDRSVMWLQLGNLSPVHSVTLLLPVEPVNLAINKKTKIPRSVKQEAMLWASCCHECLNVDWLLSDFREAFVSILIQRLPQLHNGFIWTCHGCWIPGRLNGISYKWKWNFLSLTVRSCLGVVGAFLCVITWSCLCVRVCVCVCMYVCMYVCTYLYMYVLCMYVSTYVCMYVCMGVRM